MPQTVLIPLADLLKNPLNEVGEKGRELAHLASYQLPIPKTFCLPKSALLDIAKFNQLEKKVEKLLPQKAAVSQLSTEIKHKIYSLIKSQSIPDSISNKLLKDYESAFSDKEFVRLIPGHFETTASHDYRFLKGDATVFEAIFSMWADLVLRNLQGLRSQILDSEQLIPSSILIQSEPDSVSSGFAFTKHPRSGNKSTIYIESQWGVYQADQQMSLSTFEVSVQNWKITHQHVISQKEEWTLLKSGLTKKRISSYQQTKPSLSKTRLQQLAQLVREIKQRYLDHKQIFWTFDGRVFYLTEIKEMDVLAIPTSIQSLPTKTQLFISAGNPQKANQIQATDSDGLLIRSDYTYVKFGYHPLHALKNRSLRTLLAKDLHQTIKTFQYSFPSLPITYRSLDLTSGELRGLLDSTSLEATEHNPELGFRGGLKIIQQPELFKFELEILKKVLGDSSQPLNLLVPFIRRPSELLMVHQLVKQAGLFDFPHFELWWQLNTPENLLNISSYPLNKVQGLSIDLQSVHNLMLGIDGNNIDVSSNYQHQPEIMMGAIEHVLSEIRVAQETQALEIPPKVLIHFTEFNREILEKSVASGIDGIVVKPLVAAHAKVCIMEAES